MHITMTDMMPVSLCLATQELFDAVRFQKNFCDYSTLRSRDPSIEQDIWTIKKEITSTQYQKKYLEGHKAVIVSNLDKILSLATSRYTKMNIRSVEVLVSEGRSLMKKVMRSGSFEDIALLEPEFKSKILLPVYEMFLEYIKRTMKSS